MKREESPSSKHQLKYMANFQSRYKSSKKFLNLDLQTFGEFSDENTTWTQKRERQTSKYSLGKITSKYLNLSPSKPLTKSNNDKKLIQST